MVGEPSVGNAEQIVGRRQAYSPSDSLLNSPHASWPLCLAPLPTFPQKVCADQYREFSQLFPMEAPYFADSAQERLKTDASQILTKTSRPTVIRTMAKPENLLGEGGMKNRYDTAALQIRNAEETLNSIALE